MTLDHDIFDEPPAAAYKPRKLRRLSNPNEWRAFCRKCKRPANWRNIPMICECGGRRFHVQANDEEAQKGKDARK